MVRDAVRRALFLILVVQLAIAILVGIYFSPASAEAQSTGDASSTFRVGTVGFYVERPAGFTNDDLRLLSELVLSRVNEHYAAAGIQFTSAALEVAEDGIPGNTSFAKLKHTTAVWYERPNRPDVIIALSFSQGADLNLGLAIPDSSCGAAPNVVFAALRGSGLTPGLLPSRIIAEAGDTVAHELAHTLGLPHTNETCTAPNGATTVTLMHPRASAITCGFSASHREQLIAALSSSPLGSCYDVVGARLSDAPSISVQGFPSAWAGSTHTLHVETSAPILVEVPTDRGEYFPLVSEYRLFPLAADLVKPPAVAETLSLQFRAATFFGAAEAKFDLIVVRHDSGPEILGSNVQQFNASRGKLKLSVVYASDPDGEQVTAISCAAPRGVNQFFVPGLPYSALALSGKVSKTAYVPCTATAGGLSTPFTVVLNRTSR